MENEAGAATCSIDWSFDDLLGNLSYRVYLTNQEESFRFNKLKKKDQNFIDFRTNLRNVESNKFTLKEVGSGSFLDHNTIK